MRCSLLRYMIAGMLVMVLSSCGQKQEKPAPQPTPIPMPGAPEEVVMTSDNLALTMADYDRCIEVHRLMGRHFSKRALANPRFQRDELQRCFQTKFMKDYLSTHHIEISYEARQKATAELLKRNEMASVEALAAKLEIDPAKINDVIEDSMIPLTMQRHLMMSMSDGMMRIAYDDDERVLHLELADFDNTPTDEEVEAYMKNNSEALSEYLGINPSLLSSAPHVHFVRLGYRINGEDDGSTMRHWEALHLLAVQQGMDKAIEKCKAEENSGCVVINDKDNPLVEERNESNVWAFRMPEGSVSNLEKMPDYRAFRITLKLEGPQPLNLHDPVIQKNIARRAMIDTVPSPHLVSQLKQALTPYVNFKATTEALGGRFVSTASSYYQMGEQKIVTSKKVLRMLQHIKREETGLFSNPIIENDRLYVFRVTSINVTSDEDYRAHRNEWLQRRSDDPSLETLNAWLEQQIPNMASQNLMPIQEKYGILQPNGTIR